jgi:hypothetical protein
VADPTPTFRRQQRRRAIVAWATAAIVVALFAAGAIFGADEEGGHGHPGRFGYSMTASQYAGLRLGLDQGDFVERLEQTGLPENLTSSRYVELFPPHSEDFECSYWEITDRPGRVARICFSSSEGRLVQKLQRGAGDEPAGVSA